MSYLGPKNSSKAYPATLNFLNLFIVNHESINDKDQSQKVILIIAQANSDDFFIYWGKVPEYARLTFFMFHVLNHHQKVI